MRYTIEKIGNYYELFDWEIKQTVYVTLSKKLAYKNLVRLSKGQKPIAREI